MTEGIIQICNQLAAITSWKIEGKEQRLITGMQNGRLITVLNEHELMEHTFGPRIGRTDRGGHHRMPHEGEANRHGYY